MMVLPLLKRSEYWGYVGDVTTGAMKTHARSLQFIFVVRPPIYGITAIQKLPTPLMCWSYTGFTPNSMPPYLV
jgi:hypothetical protein